VSSEKHQVTIGTEVERRDSHAAGVGTVTVVIADYGTCSARLAVSSRMAKSTTSLQLRPLWRWYSC